MKDDKPPYVSPTVDTHSEAELAALAAANTPPSD